MEAMLFSMTGMPEVINNLVIDYSINKKLIKFLRSGVQQWLLRQLNTTPQFTFSFCLESDGHTHIFHPYFINETDTNMDIWESTPCPFKMVIQPLTELYARYILNLPIPGTSQAIQIKCMETDTEMWNDEYTVYYSMTFTITSKVFDCPSIAISEEPFSCLFN